MPAEEVKVKLPQYPYPVSMYRMPVGPGHYFARPGAAVNSDCGQKHVIAFLVELSNAWAPFHSSHKFGIGDILMQTGHESHFLGGAVDIYVIHKDGTEHQFEQITWESANYDLQKTTELAQLIALTISRYGGQKAVLQFLYNDKQVQGRVSSARPITTHTNHDDHIHLTFRDPQLPAGYYDSVLGLTSDARAAWEYAELMQALLADLQYLMTGSGGPSVEALQALLNAYGASQLAPLEEDGVFGPKTTARVVEFQRRNNLVTDGVVGPQTKAALAVRFK